MSPEAPGEKESKFSFKRLAGVLRSSKAAEAQPQPGSREQLVSVIADSMPHYYYKADASEQEQDRVEMIRLERQIPRDLAKDPKILLDVLGIDEGVYITDDTATGAFRKEDTLEVSPEAFQVARDNDDQAWLLKSVQKRRWTHPAYRMSETIDRLQTIRIMQGEVIASRLAQLVDYPIAETRLIQKDGRPWLAYKFVDDAKDHTGHDFEDLARLASNPSDVYNRPLFNALTGAIGDASYQGIIGPDGEYKANDTGYSPSRLATTYPLSEDDLYSKITGLFEGLEHGNIYPNNPEAQRAYGQFMEKIYTLKPDQVAALFVDFVGTDAERQRMTNEIIARRNVLIRLWNEGRFQKIAASE